MNLLSMRKFDLKSRGRQPKPNILAKNDAQANDKFAEHTKEISSLNFLLERLVADRVTNLLLKEKYESRVLEYSTLMRSLTMSIKQLKDAKVQSNVPKENQKEIIQELEQNIEDLELNIEIVGSDLEDIKSKLNNGAKVDNMDERMSKSEQLAMKMISNLDASVVRTLLWDLLDFFTTSEFKGKNLQETLKRKELALVNFQDEIDTLNERILGLSSDIDRRRRFSAYRDNGEDAVEVFQRMEEEVKDLKEKLLLTEADRDHVRNELENQKENQIEKDYALTKMRENLTLAETFAQNLDSSIIERQESLLSAQAMWDATGISLEDRDLERQRIQNCLPNTLKAILKDAEALKVSTEKDVLTLRKNLENIYNALGMKGKSRHLQNMKLDHLPLMKQSNILQSFMTEIHPTYDAAIHRRKIIAENLELILCTMELDPLNLSPKLQAIHNKKFIRSKRRRARPNELSPGMISSKDERVSKLKNIENIMNALQPMESSDIDENETISMFGSIEENNEGLQYNNDIDSLSDEYLLLCERDLKRRLALGLYLKLRE